LMDPPLSNTTRMIANSSTTDSEMATTDHTLGRFALPARDATTRTPPEPSCHQRGRAMRPVTHRPPHSCPNRCAPPGARGRTAVTRTAIRCATRTGNSTGSFPCPHNAFAANSNCPRKPLNNPAGGLRRGAEVDIPPESPAGLMRRLVRKYHDKQGGCDEHRPPSDDVSAITPTVTSTTRNPGYPQRIARIHIRRFTNSRRER
jgi:hypothetical protein